MARSIRPRGRMAGIPSPTFLRLAALCAATVFVAACMPSAAPTATAFSTPAPTQLSAAQPPSQEADDPLGPLVGGLPETWKGEIVLRGDAIRTAIDTSRDDRAFLVAGWFHDWEYVHSCPMIQPGQDMSTSWCFSFPFFVGRAAGEMLLIARGSKATLHGVEVGTAERPVVLRIHTHDRRCPAGEDGCPLRPVLLDLLWIGDQPAGPAPTRPIGDAPAGGLSREKAVAAAMRAANPHAGALHVLEARATQIWVVYPDREPYAADEWVWAIKLEGAFAVGCGQACTDKASTELVVIDYVTGAFIEGDLPAP